MNLGAALLVAMVALLLCGCNPHKKNTAAARQYTAFITRYNIYYNGDKHYKETLADMESKYEDDYTRWVFMHPIEAKADEKAPQPSGSFDRSIEKAQKAIQVRSIKKKPQRNSKKASDPEYKAWLKRDEYNPFLHNAWMMMGRGQYYNGDFLGAASTFFYATKHFTWLPNTVTEAKLWQAQSYLGLDWLYEAELILTRIKPEQLDNKSLKNLYNFCYADFLIKSKEYEKALPYLLDAIKGAKGAQKTRLYFLLGQVYAHLDRKQEAYKAFKKAGSSQSTSYRTKLNARIKQSEVYTGANIEPEVKALKRMTRYDRNKDYLDQIYYAIGNLYLSRGDTIKAIENYELAAEKSTRSGIEKAISQITLGTLYFDMRNYEKAQPCYAEAVPMLPESYPNYPLLKRRSDVLDELAVYSQNVNLQDSLLRLAAMPEDQRNAVIDKIIEDLKKKEKEEAEAAKREEYLAQQAAQGNQLQDQNSREFNINTDDSWYFYNSTTRQSGKTEFQKKWGARKLEDDWRRRNKASFNTSDFDADEEDEEGEEGEEKPELTPEEAEEKEKLEAASDPHNREYYLAQIPFTDEEKANAHEIIQDGLYNMGLILKDKLEDFPAAQAIWDRLLRDYPDNVYRLDVYYNLYLMYMRLGDTARAETYRQLILKDFPESPYGLALKNPNYIENLRQMDTKQQELYDQTYQDYLDNRNERVHQAYQTMMEEYPLSKIMPKFMFLDALAYVTEKKPEEFNAVLRDLLDRYPQTDITPIASAWLKGMAQGRQLQTSTEGKNMRGMLWDIHLSNDSAAFANDSIAAAFEINEESPQLLVLVFPTDQVSANELLYEVARFNFSSFVVKDFDLEMMNFGRLGMLVIRGFDNQKELNHYRSVMASSAIFKLPPGVQPIAISAKNFETLLREGRTFDDYFRFLQEQNYVDAQADLLQPTEIETLDEAEEAEAIRAEEASEPIDTIEQPAQQQPDQQLQQQPDQGTTVPGASGASSGPAAGASSGPAAGASSGPAAGAGQQPAAKPATQPTTTPATTPAIPDGSEGDDPLLDD